MENRFNGGPKGRRPARNASSGTGKFNTGGGKNFGRNERKEGGNDRPAYNKNFRSDFKKDAHFGNKDFSDKKPFDRERKPGSFNKTGSFNRNERFSGDRDQKRDFGNRRFSDKPAFGDKKPFDRDKKPFDRERNTGGFNKTGSFNRNDRFSGDKEQRRDFGDRNNKREFGGGEKRDFGKRNFGDRDNKREFGDRDNKREFGKREFGSGEKRPFNRNNDAGDNKEKRDFGGDKPDFKKERDNRGTGTGKTFSKLRADSSHRKGPVRRRNDETPNYEFKGLRNRRVRTTRPVKTEQEGIRLNRYIANSGVCSRREADDLISAGEIKVNGKVITEMGYRVMSGDEVRYGERRLNREKPVYVLLNKPKDYITTTSDPGERKTVMDLVADATNYRLYPVGRLDRNTTGLLLLTNDGELADKLAHPSNNIKKIYQVELDRAISKNDYETIAEGRLRLEDGPVTVDDIAILDKERRFLGVEIHSGRNRIVRRIFEHFGYDILNLDRVMYAGLSKKEIARGKWRFLKEQEVVQLKYYI